MEEKEMHRHYEQLWLPGFEPKGPAYSQPNLPGLDDPIEPSVGDEMEATNVGS